MGCPHNADFECFDCETERHTVEHPEPVEGCRTCKYDPRFGRIQISPRATPTRTEARRAKNPPRRPENSWEKGIATDSRGMPILKGLDPMPIKEYGERRHELEAERHRLRNDPNALSTP